MIDEMILQVIWLPLAIGGISFVAVVVMGLVNIRSQRKKESKK